MPEIRLLDSSVINLIAAGEVVDRPASAVKEMVENAIDAGAKHITVEIRRGGLEMIRISDDGCGMSSDNARRAFLKHSTSKISSEEDLGNISTLGFRGEALAAISAVSKVTLTTKEIGETAGTKFEVCEGKIESEEECGCPEGSCFTVRDLFFNTPARLKFMKSEPAEAGAVQSVMERLALSHPQISFRFSVNGTDRFQTPGRGDLVEAVFSVFGKEFAEMSLATDVTTGGVRVRGLVGKPIYSKANRSRQIFFLNGRYIRSPILSGGLENAYHNKMLIGRVPVCVLFVELPLSQVDVNVHPSKLEVKFADENAVAYAVRKAAEQALASDNGIVEMRMTESVRTTSVKPPVKKIPYSVNLPVSELPLAKAASPASEKRSETMQIKASSAQSEFLKTESKKTEVPVEKSGWTITAPIHTSASVPPVAPKSPASPIIAVHDVASSPARQTTSVNTPTIIISPNSKPKRIEESATQKIGEPLRLPTEKSSTTTAFSVSQEEPILFHTEQQFRLIGEAFDCYILVEKGEDVLVIDKHALHERMNFERLRKSEIPSQSLLQPIVFHLGIDENRILVENADFLARFGFILESFGDDLLIREIPAIVDPQMAEPLLQQFAESLAIGKDDSLMDQFYYDIACKASIRSGSKTTRPELEGLVAEYFRWEKELQYCPHGRPIVFSLTKKSIEKQFKRLK